MSSVLRVPFPGTRNHLLRKPISFYCIDFFFFCCFLHRTVYASSQMLFIISVRFRVNINYLFRYRNQNYYRTAPDGTSRLPHVLSVAHDPRKRPNLTISLRIHHLIVYPAFSFHNSIISSSAHRPVRRYNLTPTSPPSRERNQIQGRRL